MVARTPEGATLSFLRGLSFYRWATLVWMALVADGPQAITITEQLFERELGQPARELVAMVERCDPSADVAVGAFIDDPVEIDEQESGDAELDDDGAEPAETN